MCEVGELWAWKGDDWTGLEGWSGVMRVIQSPIEKMTDLNGTL